jgi:hypothetical protein
VAAAPFFSSIQDLLPQFPSSHKVESVLSLALDGVPAAGGDAEAPYTAAARPVAIKRADDAVSRQRAVLPRCQACRFSTTCFCLGRCKVRAKGVFLFNAFTAPTILCAQACTGGLQLLF